MTIADCTISGNSSFVGSGGGIFNTGMLTIDASTLSGNDGGSGTFGSGGGIFNTGMLTIDASYFPLDVSHNSAVRKPTIAPHWRCPNPAEPEEFSGSNVEIAFS